MEHNFDIQAIGRQFDVFGEFVRSEPVSTGHINDTFNATYDQGGSGIRYVHQRINHLVFRDPIAQMDNIERVLAHMRSRLETEQPRDLTRGCLTLVPCRNGKSFYRDADGNFWRTYVLIEGTRSFDVVSTPEQAYQAARGFGRFLRLLSDLPGPRLFETIPDFHNTPKRLAAFEQVLEEDKVNRAARAANEIAFVQSRKPIASRLLDLHKQGSLPERIVHNDTKFNNVLLDEHSGEAICIIDLDTVMPGLAHYDFGDMVRTATSPTEEDERDLSKVTLRLPFFEALARGYLHETRHIFTEREIEELAFAGKLITYEIGLRFLADHLAGDVYFKTRRPNHNLDRCRTQFRLVESIEEQEEAMRDAVLRAAEGALTA